MFATVVSGRAIIAPLVSVRIVVVLVWVATARRRGSRSRATIRTAVVASTIAGRALERCDVVSSRNSFGLGNGILQADSARCNGLDRAQIEGATRRRLRIGVLGGRRVVGSWSRSGTRGHPIALLRRVGRSTEAWLTLGWSGCRGSLLSSWIGVRLRCGEDDVDKSH